MKITMLWTCINAPLRMDYVMTKFICDVEKSSNILEVLNNVVKWRAVYVKDAQCFVHEYRIHFTNETGILIFPRVQNTCENIIKIPSYNCNKIPYTTLKDCIFCLLHFLGSVVCFSQIWKVLEHRVGPRRVKIGPIKGAKLNWSFDKLFSAWKIGRIWWFMEMVLFF
jgi:hypothetical protein